MKRGLSLCKVEPAYLKYLHGLDSRISVKFNNRPFVGVIVVMEGLNYVLPLTSQTTQKRKQEGKRKRSALLTTFVKDSSGEEIANILHNNMFPVKDGTYTLLAIDPKQDTYESNEIRFIRKNEEKIIAKTINLRNKRLLAEDMFLVKTCCDFKNLEEHYLDFQL